jgi:hypothetical protein
MAHFAKIGLNSKVIDVVVVNNNELLDANGNESEKNGIDFLTKLTGWSIWKQTSYNTYGGQHNLGGTPFRKNYAGIGDIYDEDRDAFYNPQPYPSWNLNEETCIWECPVEKPSFDPDTQLIDWNEDNQTWDITDK